MKPEVMEQIVGLLASECGDIGENLDELEARVIEQTRELGRGTIQTVLRAKKRAIRAPHIAVNAAKKPVS